jgi:RNA-binding protein YlmH
MERDESLKKRFIELANKSYNQGIYTFTEFVGLNELNILKECELDIRHAGITEYGGTSDCERVMIRFGSEDICGYEMPFPISIVLCQPLSDKFAEKLSHRDFLGAILNLGIDRSVLGDIAIVDNRAYILVKEGMAEFVADSLTKVRKTSVKCSIVDSAPEGTLYNTKEIRVQAVGERIDALVAKVFSISRDDSATLFSRGLVFISGKCCESTSHKLKEGDIVSVRGYGRFVYRGVEGHTKKGKLNILIEQYV